MFMSVKGAGRFEFCDELWCRREEKLEIVLLFVDVRQKLKNSVKVQTFNKIKSRGFYLVAMRSVKLSFI